MKGAQTNPVAVDPPTATILSFPVDREALAVRETARQIYRRGGALAAKFWRTEQNRLYGRLQVAGLKPDEINAEINRFAAAVSVQLKRLQQLESAARETEGAA